MVVVARAHQHQVLRLVERQGDVQFAVLERIFLEAVALKVAKIHGHDDHAVGQFSELGSQAEGLQLVAVELYHLSVQACVAAVGLHNLALRTDEHTVGYAVEVVGLGHLAEAVFANQLCPLHLFLVQSLVPGLVVGVHRHAHNVEALGMVQAVELFQVGNGATAGAAPRCPELQQRVVALAQILRQLVVATVGVHQRHVGKRGSLGRALNHVGMLQHGLSLSGGLHFVADGCHKALDSGVVKLAERLVECHYTSQVVAVARDEVFQERAGGSLGRVLACQFFHHVVHRRHAVLIVVLLAESVAQLASALGIVGASLLVLAVQVVQG